MRKLVIKTVLITLAVIILIGVCVFGGFAIFSPKVIGDKSEQIGSYKIACWAYEKQYEKDKTEEAFNELDFIYKKYAISLIEKGKYIKATDVIISAKEDGFVSQGSVELVKYELQLANEKENVSSIEKSEILSCINKIKQSIDN